VSQARVIYFGAAAIYLVGAVVQFFLAGLGVFGASSYDAHRAFGLILVLVTLVLLVLSIVGRMPRTTIILTVVLLGLNVLQMVLANTDVGEIAALHPVNGVVIVFLAYELTQRSRRYVASKMAA
jgi:Family of unknown function (DUF6220)